MRRRGECKVEGCTNERVEGAYLCETHIGEKRRCEGVVHVKDETTGEVIETRQCKKSARPGLTVCASHGGSSPRSDVVVARSQALTAMQKFVEPYRGNLDPISVFEEEFRRTYGRIHWLEAQISEIREEDFIWGVTKEEHIGAAEFAGTNTTSEARVHIYEEMLWKERKHLLDMEKVWIGAKLEEKKLNSLHAHADWTWQLIIEAAKMLGHDPSEPEVRDRLLLLFAGGAGMTDEGRTLT